MKSLARKLKHNVQLTSLLTYIPLVLNVICGLFLAVGYYHIGSMLGLISLIILLKGFIISTVKRQRIKQANIEAYWENEEKEFEALLNKAQKEAKEAVEIQLKEQYNEQLKKVIYNVLLDSNIIDSFIANEIERILLDKNKKDFVSDEELYLIVERTLHELRYQKSAKY